MFVSKWAGSLSSGPVASHHVSVSVTSIRNCGTLNMCFQTPFSRADGGHFDWVKVIRHRPAVSTTLRMTTRMVTRLPTLLCPLFNTSYRVSYWRE